MSISYSWRVEDMQWDDSTGMVVYVRADYVGTYTSKVGSATTSIVEVKDNKELYLTTNDSPIGINTLTPSDVKGWLDSEFSEELPTMKKEIGDVLKKKGRMFHEQEQPTTYPPSSSKFYRPANKDLERTLPNSTWSSEPDVGKVTE